MNDAAIEESGSLRLARIRLDRLSKAFPRLLQPPDTQPFRIQQFIENEPSVSQPSPGKKSQNLAATSALEDEDLVTETLARIHAAQGNISKAIKIYDKLALLCPEKKSYFANQISKLKK